LLAMDSSAPRLTRPHALSLTTIASRLAPTRDRAPQINESAQKVVHVTARNTANAKTCRSQLAGDGLQCAAFNQTTRVIVNDHRQQAGSYKGPCPANQ